MANTVLQDYMNAHPDKGPVESAVEVILDNLSAGAAGGLTNAQLRASAVPVSGPATDAQIRASAIPVSGPATDTQLRASALPVSNAVIGTIADAAWSGTGNATVISLLKKIALNTTPA